MFSLCSGRFSKPSKSFPPDLLARFEMNTSEVKMQGSKNDTSLFTNLQDEPLVVICLWFPRFLSTYCKNQWSDNM